MNDNQKKFCDNCGTENQNLKKCKNCNHLLNPKFPNLRDYLYSKIKDQIKGEITDSLDKIIRLYIKKHFLGITVGIAIVIAGASNLIVNNQYISNTSTNSHKITGLYLSGCYHDEVGGRAYNFVGKNKIIKYNYEQLWDDENQGVMRYISREFDNPKLDISSINTKSHFVLIDKKGEYVRNIDVEYKNGNFIEYLEYETVVYSPIECNKLLDMYGKPIKTE